MPRFISEIRLVSAQPSPKVRDRLHATALSRLIQSLRNVCDQVRRVLDGDRPRAPIGALAGHPQITTEVHAGAGGARSDDLADHDVRGEALTDPTRIEPGPENAPSRYLWTIRGVGYKLVERERG